MKAPWYVRLIDWLCDKARHPLIRKEWHYNGFLHRECQICGTIISTPAERAKRKEES